MGKQIRMDNQLSVAIVIATGKRVRVFQNKSGKWYDFEDLETKYKEEELEFI